MAKLTFEQWIAILEEDVIQGEFGYEPGEFTVYPDLWIGLYRKGLTPSQAFQRALDDHAEARRAADIERQENWERIQKADAAAILRYRAALAPSTGAQDSASRAEA